MKPKKGYIQIYTGEGKGKTTAALGLALRASAAGLRVFIGQFCKGRRCSEHLGLMKLGKNITLLQSGDRCFIRKPDGKQIRDARLAFSRMKERVLSGKYNVVILDEVCVAIQLGMLDEKELLDCFAKKPEHVEIVCTGRGASKKLIKAADLVTEMRAIKHYFNAKNVKARKGIEF